MTKEFKYKLNIDINRHKQTIIMEMPIDCIYDCTHDQWSDLQINLQQALIADDVTDCS